MWRRAFLIGIGSALAMVFVTTLWAASTLPAPPHAKLVQAKEVLVGNQPAHVTQYTTSLPPTEVVQYYSSTLARDGWEAGHGYRDTQVAVQAFNRQSNRGREHVVINTQVVQGRRESLVFVNQWTESPEEIARAATRTDLDRITFNAEGWGEQSVRDIVGVPRYPGARAVSGTEHQRAQTVNYATTDSPEAVVEHYRRVMPLSGWRETSDPALVQMASAVVSGSERTMLFFEDATSSVTLLVQRVPQFDQTMIGVIQMQRVRGVRRATSR